MIFYNIKVLGIYKSYQMIKTAFLNQLLYSTIILSCLTTNSYANYQKPDNYQIINAQQDDEVIATINGQTTHEQLQSLQKFFATNGIDLQLSFETRDTQGLLTGLQINMRYQQQQKSMQFSQNIPISNIELGRKDGVLFIKGQQNGDPIADFFNNEEMQDINQMMQSAMPMMQQFMQGFLEDPSENSENNSNSGSSKAQNRLGQKMPSIESFMERFNQMEQDIDVDRMHQQLRERMSNLKGGSIFGKIMNDLQNNLEGMENRMENRTNNYRQNNGFPKYNPDQLIVINGEISNFETLTILAQANKIDAIDQLNPKTAMSIYGNKGNKGALIVTKKP